MTSQTSDVRRGYQEHAPRIQRFVDESARLAAGYGHKLTRWGYEGAWDSVVTHCVNCGEIAAIDLSEQPYTFGRATKRRCDRSAA